MKIDPEDFAQWRENPITLAVRKAYAAKAQEAKQRWLSMSWDGGQIDPLLLSDLRARSETWEDFCELTLDELEAALGED